MEPKDVATEALALATVVVANPLFCGISVAVGHEDARLAVTLAVSGSLLCTGIYLGMAFADRRARKEEQRRRR